MLAVVAVEEVVLIESFQLLQREIIHLLDVLITQNVHCLVRIDGVGILPDEVLDVILQHFTSPVTRVI
jgi:hypothetical protein